MLLPVFASGIVVATLTGRRAEIRGKLVRANARTPSDGTDDGRGGLPR
jgi:hypothetical protein